MKIYNETGYIVFVNGGTTETIPKGNIRFWSNNSDILFVLFDTGVETISGKTYLEIKCSDVELPSGTWNATNLAAVLKTYQSDTTGTGDVNISEVGNVAISAHDAAMSEPPLGTGGKASTSKPSAVDNGDKVYAYYDEYGRLHVINDAASGVSGGGLGTWYMTPSNAANQGQTLRTAAATFTATAHPLTLSSGNITRIDRYNSANVFQETITQETHVVTISGTTVTVTGMTSSAGDLFYMWYNGEERTIHNGSNTQMVSVDNPEYGHTTDPERLVDEVNQSAGTYRNIIHRDEFKYLSIHLRGSGGVTFTIWASNDDTADDTADTGWVDISLLVMGAASLVDSEDIYFVDTPIMPQRMMIKHVCSDATNATDVIIKQY